MALIITEYEEIAYAGAGLQVPQEPPLAVQVVAISGASAASDAFHVDTKFISIQLDADGYVQFGASPTAVNTGGSETSLKHKADAVSWHGVAGGSKVAAITA